MPAKEIKAISQAFQWGSNVQETKYQPQTYLPNLEKKCPLYLHPKPCPFSSNSLSSGQLWKVKNLTSKAGYLSGRALT
jgi:hypothetical protein